MIRVFSVQVWHSSRTDLRARANTPDKLHNVHLHRGTQTTDAPCRLILLQRLLKAGECMLVNVDCIPWSQSDLQGPVCTNLGKLHLCLWGWLERMNNFCLSSRKVQFLPKRMPCTFFYFCPLWAEQGDGHAALAMHGLCSSAREGNKERLLCKEAMIFPSISQSLNSLVCLCLLKVRHGKYNTMPDPGISS